MYYNFFIHSSVDGHQSCFHVLDIANSATVNNGTHVSFWIMVFSGCMSSCGIAWSYGSLIPRFFFLIILIFCCIWVHILRLYLYQAEICYKRKKRWKVGYCFSFSSMDPKWLSTEFILLTFLYHLCSDESSLTQWQGLRRKLVNTEILFYQLS